MDIDEAVALTQDRLTGEGGTMGDLLGHFRNRVSPVLVGDSQWQRILECARKLPITMGALPFGFELPLHARSPKADFGVSPCERNRSGGVLPGARPGRPDGTRPRKRLRGCSSKWMPTTRRSVKSSAAS